MPGPRAYLFFPATLAAVFLTASSALAQYSQRVFGAAAGWDIVAMYEGPSFVGCAASHRQATGESGIAMNAGGNWILAFQMPTPQGVVPAQMTIDGQFWGFPVTGEGNRVNFGASAQIMDAVRTGNVLTITVPGSTFTAVLAGSSAAMAMVETCVRRRGN
jgi:hypothetical protein